MFENSHNGDPQRRQFPLIQAPHQSHGPNVHLLALDKVVDNSKNNRAAIDKNVPVHCRWHHFRSKREKGEHIDDKKEEDAGDVDPDAMTAQRPFRRRERFFAEAFDEETGEGDEVGGDEGCDA